MTWLLSFLSHSLSFNSYIFPSVKISNNYYTITGIDWFCTMLLIMYLLYFYSSNLFSFQNIIFYQSFPHFFARKTFGYSPTYTVLQLCYNVWTSYPHVTHFNNMFMPYHFKIKLLMNYLSFLDTIMSIQKDCRSNEKNVFLLVQIVELGEQSVAKIETNNVLMMRLDF